MSADMPPGSGLGDILDKGNSLLGSTDIDPKELLLAKQCVRRHVRSSQERHELYLMLDLYEPGSPHREQTTFDMAARRAVPDSFRRGRATKAKP